MAAPEKPEQSRYTERPVPTTVETTFLDIGRGNGYGWRIVSDCGVVKVYSTRDGCMMAIAPMEARVFAAEFMEAMNDAADCTEVRSYGHVVSAASDVKESRV